MVESGSSMVDSAPASGRSHVRIPLNSMRITAGQLPRLGLTLGITVSGSISDQRLLVEGKLGEESHNPCNVQVVFEVLTCSPITPLNVYYYPLKSLG